METLQYLGGYAPALLEKVQRLIAQDRLGAYLMERYPEAHQIRSPKALSQYTLDLKNTYMRRSGPLSKVVYSEKIDVMRNALGVHTRASRVQGNKLKAKRAIQIDALFKKVPEDFLRMIVVHELAHFKEADHNKAFYQLCEHMEPDYHQLEFDLRLYLTFRDQKGEDLW
ncbi:M48 metallopeptidase family protein [Acanthopleuribacter pedis]|uniref:M48 family metallopeptidase n=1 Tax=Acanthopleuribacter pedis TaxID=442870 RepID=A0A8J7U4U4_9BACT|nr:YgjP-like metallopeptidase domain-containing protein [Acanthopleuribacter pedis]MBO1317359.1 M48 family metallopeptidase [Acanthopleuribacter pedis]MBO1318666.1 M48 family metallopeptidase [Acanthopleuribacter pedis]